jgi:hypothetical protein
MAASPSGGPLLPIPGKNHAFPGKNQGCLKDFRPAFNQGRFSKREVEMSLLQISEVIYSVPRNAAVSRPGHSGGVWRRLLMWIIQTRRLQAEKLIQRNPSWRHGPTGEANDDFAEDHRFYEIHYLNGRTGPTGIGPASGNGGRRVLGRRGTTSVSSA